VAGDPSLSAEVRDFGPYEPIGPEVPDFRGAAIRLVAGTGPRGAAGPVDNSRAVGTERGSLSTVPRPLPPLPAPLQGCAFTLAQGRAAMVSQARLEAADLVRPTWGVRAHHHARTVDELAHTVGLALEGTYAFSHLTAARLWRLPLPTAWSRDEPLHVMRDGTPLRRAGVVGHRGLAGRRQETLRGLPVTSPVDTWVDLARVPGVTVEDLVIAGDAFSTRTPDLLDPLVCAAAAAGGRGRRLLRKAGPLLRRGSGSPMETRARLAFGRAGLPEPELNAEVFAEDGHFLARVDFLWREARVIVEYEGDQHRTDRRQWQSDIQRTRLLESLGRRVVRMTAADLYGAGLTRFVAELATLVA
jgi:hypothetical protein